MIYIVRGAQNVVNAGADFDSAITCALLVFRQSANCLKEVTVASLDDCNNQLFFNEITDCCNGGQVPDPQQGEVVLGYVGTWDVEVYDNSADCNNIDETGLELIMTTKACVQSFCEKSKSESVDWSDITNKPPCFSPCAHTHPLEQIQQSGALDGQVPTWNAVSGKWEPQTVETGSVEWDDIQNKPFEFPPAPHTHTLNQIEQSGASDGEFIKWEQASFQWVPTTLALQDLENIPSPPADDGQQYILVKVDGGYEWQLKPSGGGAVTAPDVTFDPAIQPFANLQEFSETVDAKLKAIVTNEAEFDSAMNDVAIQAILLIKPISFTLDKNYQSVNFKEIRGASIIINPFFQNNLNISLFNVADVSFYNDIILNGNKTLALISESINPSCFVRIKRVSLIGSSSNINFQTTGTGETNFIYESVEDGITVTDDGNPTTIVNQQLWFTSPSRPEDILQGGATDGQVITWNDAQGKWIPETPTGGGAGVASLTGDGVDNTDPSNPVVSFPTADEVDDSSTVNKFVTDAEKQQISDNTQASSDNSDRIDAVEVTVIDNNNDITTLFQTKLDSVQAGAGVTVDNTDPKNPIISADSGGNSELTFVSTEQELKDAIEQFPTGGLNIWVTKPILIGADVTYSTTLQGGGVYKRIYGHPIVYGGNTVTFASGSNGQVLKFYNEVQIFGDVAIEGTLGFDDGDEAGLQFSRLSAFGGSTANLTINNNINPFPLNAIWELKDDDLTVTGLGSSVVRQQQWFSGGGSGGSGGVQSVTGDGVGGTADDVVLSFPTADEVDDSSTTNKFITQAEKDQIATNTGEISNTNASLSVTNANVATNADGILNNSNAIGANETAITANENGVQQNATDIATNQSQILDNNNAISDANNAISQNSSDITSIQSAVSNNISSIGDLENNKLDSVQAGTGVTIDNSDPKNPIISADSAGGGEKEIYFTATGQTLTDIVMKKHSSFQSATGWYSGTGNNAQLVGVKYASGNISAGQACSLKVGVQAENVGTLHGIGGGTQLTEQTIFESATAVATLPSSANEVRFAPVPIPDDVLLYVDLRNFFVNLNDMEVTLLISY